MTYTQLAIGACCIALILDLLVLRTRLVRRKIFWTSCAIIFFFQLLTNAAFTGQGIVRYSGSAIVGSSSPIAGTPTFIGDGRVFFAPVEDLGFGFALVLLTLSLWVWLGKRGVQQRPTSGPPRWRR